MNKEDLPLTLLEAGSYSSSSPGSVEVVLSVESARDALRKSRSPSALLFTMGTATVLIESEPVVVVVSWRGRESGELPPLLTALSTIVSLGILGGSPRDSRVCWKEGIRLELAMVRRANASCRLNCMEVRVDTLFLISLVDLCTC